MVVDFLNTCVCLGFVCVFKELMLNEIQDMDSCILK